MANTFRVIDYDIVYLSYDEPNAEKNYADLCKKVPWAKRVHGVEGSDSAHKAVLVRAPLHLLSSAGLLLPPDDRLHEYGIRHGAREPNSATLRLPDWPTHTDRFALTDV